MSPCEPAEATPDSVTEDATGRFVRTDKKLGNGTIKLVFLARDEEEGVDVAWNELDTTRASPEAVTKFLNEIAILERLEHTNVLKCTTHFTYGVKVVYITEMMTGGTLKAFIAQSRNHRLKCRVTQKVCRQLVKGLQYLHSQEPPVIHSNLMCENIFIDAHNCEVKLGDFGLSGRLGCVSPTGHRPEFMGPEILAPDGLGYTCKGDVYSLGMCVLEMVSGQYPYSECHGDEQAVRTKVLAGQLPQALDLDILEEHRGHARDFIVSCLAPYAARPSSGDLGSLPFLSSTIPPDIPSIPTSRCFGGTRFMGAAALSRGLSPLFDPQTPLSPQYPEASMFPPSATAPADPPSTEPYSPENHAEVTSNGLTASISESDPVGPSVGDDPHHPSPESPAASECSIGDSAHSFQTLRADSHSPWGIESLEGEGLAEGPRDSLDLEASLELAAGPGCPSPSPQGPGLPAAARAVDAALLAPELLRLLGEEEELLARLRRLEHDYHERAQRRGERLRRVEDDLRRHGIGLPRFPAAP